MNCHRPFTLNIRGRLTDFPRPVVMGIVNATPDSFFAGSRAATADAVRARVAEMRAAGADMLDIGGYSSRPGAPEVSTEEECRRLELALSAARQEWPEAVVSVDTFRAQVARRCVEEWGADIVNDIGGGTLDPEMWPTVAELRVPYVLMHMRGTPETMSQLTDYDDVAADVVRDLAFKIDSLRQLGVADVIVDPGFGFAKTIDQNFRLLARMEEFKALGAPLFVGVSRKSMVYKTLGVTPEESLPGTSALNTMALERGADILRVHDVAEAVQVRAMVEKVFEND